MTPSQKKILDKKKSLGYIKVLNYYENLGGDLIIVIETKDGKIQYRRYGKRGHSFD